MSEKQRDKKQASGLRQNLRNSTPTTEAIGDQSVFAFDAPKWSTSLLGAVRFFFLGGRLGQEQTY